jgi:EAL and modified HD-GYP domain-containing signal transduction protein
MSSDGFPLLVLQPTLGPGQDWAGVRVLGAETADAATLGRLFDEFGLAQAVPGLDCLLPATALALLAGAALPAGLTLQADSGEPAPPPATHPAGKGPTQALLLKILAQTTGDAETREIEATLKQDPTLSVQLLRLVNSVAFAPNTRINSFAHAITLLGRRQLQRWLQLLLYAGQSGGANNPLLTAAALRAALMEGLCKASRADKAIQDEAFMVGMFSLLDRLFGKPLREIVTPLNLVRDVNEALLNRSGTLGELLALIEAAESGPEAIGPGLRRVGISNEGWYKVQVDALGWTLRISRESKAAG